jgi:hypothetical protein
VRASGGSSQGVELVRASEWVVASAQKFLSQTYGNAGCMVTKLKALSFFRALSSSELARDLKAL